MQVKEVMSPNVRLASPDDDLQHAAQLMAQLDAGALPVVEDDRMIGMITDRDIAIRAIAEGRDLAQTCVRDVMTTGVKYCYADESVERVARNMADIRVRRLPVVDRRKRLVGIVSLGDVSRGSGASASGHALRGVSVPGGPHSQSAGRGHPGLGQLSRRLPLARSPLDALLAAGLSAALTYYLDPVNGRTRRARLEDRLASFANRLTSDRGAERRRSPTRRTFRQHGDDGAGLYASGSDEFSAPQTPSWRATSSPP